MPLYALGGGLLATSLLTALELRRRRQQRHRGIGRRILLPKGSAAAAERALRATEQPEAPVFIDTTLRSAAIQLAADGRELPDLTAMVYGPGGLELHLAEPAAPVSPFSSLDGNLARWICPAGSGELLGSDRTDAIEAPYPALVTVGSTPDGRTVLADLEHYGFLLVTGPARRHVLRAIAVELATSRYAEHLEVAIVGATACPGLAELVPEWFTVHDNPKWALHAAEEHHRTQEEALAALGAASLRQARLRGEDASTWTPFLLLADDTGSEATDALATLADRHPRTAGAVVTAVGTSSTVLPAGGWQLDTTTGQVHMPGTGLTVSLQTLPDDAYADVINLLADSDESRPDTPTLSPYIADDRPVAATAEVPGPVVLPALPKLGAGTQAALPGLAPFETSDAPDPQSGLLADLADFGDLTDEDTEPEATSKPETPPVAEAGPEAKPVPVVPAPTAPVQAAAPAEPADPLIRILGPVDIIGVKGTADSKYLRTVTEIAAWMVLHPGLDHHALDEAVWPGRDVSRKTRNPWISRLRSLLGTAADGTGYLPAIATTPDARYPTADLLRSLLATATSRR